MKLLKRFNVKKNERGLLYSEGDFVAILEPGAYRHLDLGNRLSVETFSLNTPNSSTAWPATCASPSPN